MSYRNQCALLLCSLLCLASCADDLKKRLASETDGGDQHDESAVIVDDEPGVSHQTVLDASSQDTPVYLDLETGKKVSADDAWDLSFRRFHVQMNGGVSGEGGVQATIVEAEGFDDVREAPRAGFSTDESDGAGDPDSDPDNLFNNGESDWYDYDSTTHTLSSKHLTYVVSSSEQKLYKLIIDGYYDEAGSPAIFTLRWAGLMGEAPAGDESTRPTGDEPDAVSAASTADDAGQAAQSDAETEGGSANDAGSAASTLKLDTSSGTDWIYINFAGELVKPGDPAQNLDWDLAFKRTELRTNSGTSGKGHGGAKQETRPLGFTQIEAADTFDYATDTLINSGAPGAVSSSQNGVLAGWYDYDPATHVVSPGDRSYIVRGASGSHAKLRIVAYQSGMLEIMLTPIARTLAMREVDVDATSSETWAYLSLRQSVSLMVTDPGNDLRWDLAISRTRFRTNGGTSGMGLGAAAEAASAELSAPGAIPAQFSGDTEVTSGPPGSPPVSGNAVLAAWYDYDITTHVVTPRNAVFLTRTADGGLGAFKILTYNSGSYRLAFTYAGAGASGF